VGKDGAQFSDLVGLSLQQGAELIDFRGDLGVGRRCWWEVFVSFLAFSFTGLPASGSFAASAAGENMSPSANIHAMTLCVRSSVKFNSERA
jgi:hypothetical protein